MKTLLHSAVVLALLSCSAPKIQPYACGPVMNQKSVRQTFQPLIDYMGLKNGHTFADVGASSGYFTVMMATLMENNSIYIQDIDTACLNEREVGKVIDYYSAQSKKSLRSLHTFHLTVGTVRETNLPDNTIDKIYSNATFHQLTEPDLLVKDLYSKLKADGELYIRDSFTDKNEIEYCEDKKCARPRTRIIDFLKIMARNGFVLKKNMEYSGFPIYMFTK